jgi:hypothetical protein
MSKLIKIFIRFIGIILEWALIVVIFFAFAIRSSKFQTYLGKQATAYLSKELKTKISIDKVDIYFFDKVALDGVFILDKQKDTLADIKSVFVTLNSFDSKKNSLDLKEINLKTGNVKLYRDKKNGEFNFQFISDYFASSDTSASEPMELKFRKIKLTQVNFKYDDFRKPFSNYGIDYDHLFFRNLYLTTGNINILKSGGIESYIRHISFREKSGFELDKFSGKVAFDNKGLRINYLTIFTPKSKMYFSKLHLNIDKPEDFNEFVDKVVFDVEMKKSLISLDDISIFATALEGMKQKIVMQATITKHIKDLKIANLDLSTGKKTKLRGTFNLPDFREFEKSFFNERIEYAYIDLNDIEAVLLPVSSKERNIKLDQMVKKLNYVSMKDFRLDGVYSNFVVKSDEIKTQLGGLNLDHGIMFTEKANSYTFEKSYASEYDVKIDSFQLGNFISNKDIGVLSGQFFLEGEIFSSGKIDFNSIQGDLKRFDYLDYTYRDIEIKEGAFVDNVFEGKVDIGDDNLNLTYNGLLDFNTKQHFKFDIDITEAVLDNLNLSKVNNTVLKSSFSVNISGTNSSNYSGEITLDGLLYNEGDNKFEVPSMVIRMNRSEMQDILSITSDLVNASVKGKVDFATVGDEINNQFSAILPAIFKAKAIKKSAIKNKFDYLVEFNEVNEFFNIFAPGLKIAPGSRIDGFYDAAKSDFMMNFNSSKISYNDIVLNDLKVEQLVNKSNLDAIYTVSRFALNDSMYVDNAKFTANGVKDEINSELRWNPGTLNETFFSWKTIVNDLNSFFFNINPSYFAIREHKWEINDNSQVLLAPNDIQIQNFRMQRDNQFVTIDGCISEQNEDILKLDINALQLEDFTSLFGLPIKIQGELNGVASVSDPFQDISFTSDAAIRDLFIDGAEVGDINLKGAWGKASESIDLSGELFYKKAKTFNFDGSYYLAREKNSLDFDLNFDYTDLQFTNAFMDPQVVSGLRGLVDGDLKITGTPEEPVMEGAINLMGGNAKVEMFGVNFGFSGEIYADKDGIYIDNMPLMDEDGNTGSLIGTVYHQNFANWNFDLAFNLSDDAYALNNLNKNQDLDRFLVMNTQYKEGEIYFGKAYVTGNANIFGYAENLYIDVNLETKKGTTINFPMYGTGDIEEDKFITFTPKSNSGQNNQQPKIDFTGVSMGLNFKVTPDAELKIIFDDNLKDEIIAKGEGDIAIKLDDIGDVEMIGDFTISDGSVYNFVMPPVKQPFIIEKGGTIVWTGDPVNARLNLRTYASIETTLAEINPNIESSSSYQSKEVKCYLNLTETLLNPLITFDIQVPKASESETVSLNRIKGNQDDLNKQFFSLLLVKKFQPIDGKVSAGSGAALDLVSGQINEILGKMSSDVKLKVGLTSDVKTFDVSKNLYNDRLILKTSVGVESANSQNQSSFIGDVNLEYLINEDGTFRVSIFNESNDNTVIQEKNLGQFTQGAGLNYQEDFNNFRDFKMAQYFLDIFRESEKKRYPIKKKRQQKDIPTETQKTISKPDEE